MVLLILKFIILRFFNWLLIKIFQVEENETKLNSMSSHTYIQMFHYYMLYFKGWILNIKIGEQTQYEYVP
jgi:hypothetical protein